MKKEEQKSILQRIQVKSKHRYKPSNDDVYIGEDSIFKNPYTYMSALDESMEAYKEYFQDIIDSCGCMHKTFKNELRKMIVRLKLDGEVNLICDCESELCHGEIIRDYILTQI